MRTGTASLLRAQQVEERPLDLLVRHGRLTVPELHHETLVLELPARLRPW